MAGVLGQASCRGNITTDDMIADDAHEIIFDLTRFPDSDQPFNKKENAPNPVLTETLPQEEDYCFTQDGHILMGHNGVLYIKKNPFTNPSAAWEQLTDMKKFGIEKFYRMAMSIDNTKLAIVAYQGKKP